MNEESPFVVTTTDNHHTGEGEDTSWKPSVGPVTTDFLNSLDVPDASRDAIRTAAVGILGDGVAPSGPHQRRTGLVVGYVQSGKTMSFQAVAALAHDNGFPLVIIIAGISTSLLKQSVDRVRRDFQLSGSQPSRHWVLLKNPGIDDLQLVRNTLDMWSDPSTPPEYRRTVLITVLKNHHRLKAVVKLLALLGARDVPALIIDDEADQASLNIHVRRKPDSEPSTTYRRLIALRDTLPHHTYLQYTATPQAPLLISIIDTFSPDFVRVLAPGGDYVGGQAFFSNDNSLIRIIPSSDLPSSIDSSAGPPPSLVEALAIFLVGLAVSLASGEPAQHRSMLVHPSQRTRQHHEYYVWLRSIIDEWKSVLALPSDDLDKLAVLEDFREAFDDLHATVGSTLPPFDRVVNYLSVALNCTQVLEVNAAETGTTPPVNWGNAIGYILVGGQAMDRGFTVQGLTVTYMPRGIGVGNADTIQQRARFYGYKQSYLTYCRLYLAPDTHEALANYITHEKYVRGELITIQETRSPLKSWKRAFVLDRALRPCRQQVLKYGYVRKQIGGDWVHPKMVLAPREVLRHNGECVRSFLGDVQLSDDEGDAMRTPTQRHLISRSILLADVLDRLLVDIRITQAEDVEQNILLLLHLKHLVDQNPDMTCTVYRMSPSVERQRGVDDAGKLRQLFQGAYPVSPKNRIGAIYPGDRELREDDTVTIQIHMVSLTRGDGPLKKVLEREVPVIAALIPEHLGEDWLSQVQS